MPEVTTEPFSCLCLWK